jgi:flagellar biogenesis protein FliO
VTDNLQPILFFLKRRGVASFNGLATLSGRGQGAVSRQLKVVERLPLGPQHTLHLVRVGERTILVATTPGSCQIMDAEFREASTL